MAIKSDAQRKAVAKYNATNYDKILLTVKKGHRDELKAHAAARGESLNGFISRAISEALERDNGGEGASAPAANAETEVKE